MRASELARNREMAARFLKVTVNSLTWTLRSDARARRAIGAAT